MHFSESQPFPRPLFCFLPEQFTQQQKIQVFASMLRNILVNAAPLLAIFGCCSVIISRVRPVQWADLKNDNHTPKKASKGGFLTNPTQTAGTMDKSLWCKDILTVVRLNPRELWLPEFVLLHYVTKVANEECVIFVLEMKIRKWVFLLTKFLKYFVRVSKFFFLLWPSSDNTIHSKLVKAFG